MISDREFLMFEDGYFKPYFEKYIEYKRGKGEKVARSTIIRLRKLNNDLNQYDCQIISQSMIEELLAPRDGLSESARQYTVSSLRQFSNFLNSLGITAATIPTKFMRSVKNEFRPYIFTDDEISLIVYTADHLPKGQRTNHHQLVYPLIMRILIGTGMRIGEVLALNVGDVDIESGIISVIDGKNGVSRYIPVSTSLKRVLKKYIDCIETTSDAYPFFVSPYTGQHYSYDAVRHMFQKIFTTANIYRPDGHLANIHSIRHTFCTKSLSQMLSSGMNVYTAIPILAAYVGHVNYRDTEKYIHFTEQDYDSFLEKEASLGALIPEVDYE